MLRGKAAPKPEPKAPAVAPESPVAAPEPAPATVTPPARVEAPAAEQAPQPEVARAEQQQIPVPQSWEEAKPIVDRIVSAANKLSPERQSELAAKFPDAMEVVQGAETHTEKYYQLPELLAAAEEPPAAAPLTAPPEGAAIPPPNEQSVAPPAEPPAHPPPEPPSVHASDDPFLSRIANRFTQERAKSGELGEIAPGQGYGTRDLVQRGLRMPPEEVAQHVSDVMQGTGADPVAQAAAIRAEEARLSDRSNELSRAAEANPRDIEAAKAADDAFRALTDFHNGPIAKLKTRFHATGMALQGELPVDLSTFNGLREQWLKDNGKPPPASVEPALRRTAGNVSRVVGEERTAMQRLGQEIDRTTRGRKFPTPEEVRDAIIERMKNAPCR